MNVLSRPCRARWSYWLALTALCACADKGQVTTENVLLAKGQFHSLSWGGTQLERFYVMAHGGTPDDPSGSVLLVSPDNSEPCELGPESSRYLRPLQPQNVGSYVVGSPSPTRIMLFDDLDMNRVGTLKFADIHCQRMGLQIPNAQYVWYLFEPDKTKLQLAVLRQDGSLLFVEPWSEEQKEVTSEVTGFDTIDDGVMLIESGKLTQRDRKGELRLRRGTAVSDFWKIGSAGDVAYRDAKGLYVHRDGSDKRLADDGCSVRTLDGFMPGALAYNAPCQQGQPAALRVSAGDKTFSYAEGVESIHDDSGMLLYTTTQDDTTSLWMVEASAPEMPKLISELPSYQLSGVASLRAGKLFLKARQKDGTYTVWQLDRGDPSHELVEIAHGLLDVVVSQSGLIVLTDSGELWITNPDLSQVLRRVPNAKSSQYGFVFSGKSSAVVYLDGVDAETGQGSLELHFLNGQHLSLDHDVREWTQVWWPERGIVYARGGDAPGIYFARVDIPCESASETAWACGF